MGIIASGLYRLGIVLGVTLLLVAVAWETKHLINWCSALYEMYGDGSIAGYLRMHAYTYVTAVFGEGSLGWTVI